MNTLYKNIKSAVKLVETITSEIRSNKLKPGDSLPSVRQFAQQLGVNPNTVANAYSKLRDVGLITTQGRSGTKVAEQPSIFDTGGAIPQGLFDLSNGNVDKELLPTLPLITNEYLNLTSGYDAQEDLNELVALGKKWNQAQKLPDSSISIFSGALDVMERALRAHVLPGSKVWVEDPCWPPVLMLLNHLRLKPIPLAIDQYGCILPAENEQASAVILSPRAQNPTGVSMSAKRAKQWSDFFESHSECLLIMDDFWGPLSLNSLPQIKTSSHWIYILSLSKSLGPDLRVTLASGSEMTMNAMRRQQLIGPRWVSHLLQKVAYTLWKQTMNNGGLDKARDSYYSRQQSVISYLQDSMNSQLSLCEGVHLWIPVNSEVAVVQSMAAKGWAIQAGQPFRLKSPPAVRVSLGNVRTEQLVSLGQDLMSSINAMGWQEGQV